MSIKLLQKTFLFGILAFPLTKRIKLLYNQIKKSKNKYGVTKFIKNLRRCGKLKKYILGRQVKSRTYLKDEAENKLLFSFDNSSSKEYSLIKVAAVLFAALFGFLYLVAGFRKGISLQRTAKLQKKEIKRLEKLCKESCEK